MRHELCLSVRPSISVGSINEQTNRNRMWTIREGGFRRRPLCYVREGNNSESKYQAQNEKAGELCFTGVVGIYVWLFHFVITIAITYF